MRLYDNGCDWSVTVSASETEAWARKPGAAWPRSFLRGRRFWAAFSKRNGDLVDLSIDGGRGDQDVPCDEFNALVADVVTPKARARGLAGAA